MGTGFLRPICIFDFPHCYTLLFGTLEGGVVRGEVNILGLLTVGWGLMLNRQYRDPSISEVAPLYSDFPSNIDLANAQNSQNIERISRKSSSERKETQSPVVVDFC